MEVCVLLNVPVLLTRSAICANIAIASTQLDHIYINVCMQPSLWKMQETFITQTDVAEGKQAWCHRDTKAHNFMVGC